MPTLLIVQIAGGRSFADQFRNSMVEGTEHPGTNQGTSIVLDTMITTQLLPGSGGAHGELGTRGGSQGVGCV